MSDTNYDFQAYLDASQYLQGLGQVNQANKMFASEVERLGTKLNNTARNQAFKMFMRDMSTNFDRSNAAAGRFNLTLKSTLRLLQIQFIHTVFGSLISDFQTAAGRAIKFGEKIDEIITITNDANFTFDKWSNTLVNLSDKFALPSLDVANAAYQTLSNQVASAAESQGFLNDAFTFAKVTGSTAADSVDLISSALNSYGKDAAFAEIVSAQMFKTIELGRVRAEEVANSLGRVYSISALMGSPMFEVDAALAAITMSGIRAEKAMTLVTNVFNKLMKPSEAMTNYLSSMGYATGQQAIQAEGLIGIMRNLREEFQRGGSARVAELFPDIRANQAVSILASPNIGEVFDEAGEKIENSLDQYKRVAEERLASIRETYAREMQEIENIAINSWGRPLVEAMANFNAAGGGISELVQNLVDSVTKLVNSFQMVADAATSFLGMDDSSLVWLLSDLPFYLGTAGLAFAALRKSRLVDIAATSLGIKTSHAHMIATYQEMAAQLALGSAQDQATAAAMRHIIAQRQLELATRATTFSLHGLKAALVSTGMGIAVIGLSVLIAKALEFDLAIKHAAEGFKRFSDSVRTSNENDIIESITEAKKEIANLEFELDKKIRELEMGVRKNIADENRRLFDMYGQNLEEDFEIITDLLKRFPDIGSYYEQQIPSTADAVSQIIENIAKLSEKATGLDFGEVNNYDDALSFFDEMEFALDKIANAGSIVEATAIYEELTDAVGTFGKQMESMNKQIVSDIDKTQSKIESLKIDKAMSSMSEYSRGGYAKSQVSGLLKSSGDLDQDLKNLEKAQEYIQYIRSADSESEKLFGFKKNEAVEYELKLEERRLELLDQQKARLDQFDTSKIQEDAKNELLAMNEELLVIIAEQNVKQEERLKQLEAEKAITAEILNLRKQEQDARGDFLNALNLNTSKAAEAGAAARGLKEGAKRAYRLDNLVTLGLGTDHRDSLQEMYDLASGLEASFNKLGQLQKELQVMDTKDPNFSKELDKYHALLKDIEVRSNIVVELSKTNEGIHAEPFIQGYESAQQYLDKLREIQAEQDRIRQQDPQRAAQAGLNNGGYVSSLGYASGGMIYGPPGRDNLGIRAHAGEIVMNRNAARLYGSRLMAMNTGANSLGYYNSSTTNYGDVIINVSTTNQPDVRKIMREARQQQRRGAIR